MNIMRNNPEIPGQFVRGLPMTEDDWRYVHPLNILNHNNNCGAKIKHDKDLFIKLPARLIVVLGRLGRCYHIRKLLRMLRHVIKKILS